MPGDRYSDRGWRTAATTRPIGIEVGQRHNRELQPFGSMDGHDPHYVVARFRHGRVRFVGPTATAGRQPADKGTQTSAPQTTEGTRLIRNLDQVSGCLLPLR